MSKTYRVSRSIYIETEAGVSPEVNVTTEATIEADSWPEALAQFEFDAPTIVRLPEATRSVDFVRNPEATDG